MLDNAASCLDKANRLRAEGRLEEAWRAFSDGRDWLNSDWRPVGKPLTKSQAKARLRMFTAIRAAKDEIAEAMR